VAAPLRLSRPGAWTELGSERERHGARALAGEGEDGVGDRRRDRRRPRLAGPADLLLAGDDDDVDARRLGHAQDLVVVEVADLDAAVLDRHRLAQGGRQP
jgi:hypothetical protein